jgi:hypothetical protein
LNNPEQISSTSSQNACLGKDIRPLTIPVFSWAYTYVNGYWYQEPKLFDLKVVPWQTYTPHNHVIIPQEKIKIGSTYSASYQQKVEWKEWEKYKIITFTTTGDSGGNYAYQTGELVSLSTIPWDFTSAHVVGNAWMWSLYFSVILFNKEPYVYINHRIENNSRGISLKFLKESVINLSSDQELQDLLSTKWSARAGYYVDIDRKLPWVNETYIACVTQEIKKIQPVPSPCGPAPAGVKVEDINVFRFNTPGSPVNTASNMPISYPFTNLLDTKTNGTISMANGSLAWWNKDISISECPGVFTGLDSACIVQGKSSPSLWWSSDWSKLQYTSWSIKFSLSTCKIELGKSYYFNIRSSSWGNFGYIFSNK